MRFFVFIIKHFFFDFFRKYLYNNPLLTLWDYYLMMTGCDPWLRLQWTSAARRREDVLLGRYQKLAKKKANGTFGQNSRGGLFNDYVV